MKPCSPVLPSLRPGFDYVEGIFAKDQKPYLPLPYTRVGDCILTRWKMTLKERFWAALTGSIYLWVMKDLVTPLQPVKLQVKEPK